MTAAELVEHLTPEGAAEVQIIGRDGNHDIHAIYRGADGGIYVMLAALPETDHNACGTSECCGTCG